MVLDESAVIVPPDSTGASIRTLNVRTIDRDGTARIVQIQGVVVSDEHGFPTANPPWSEILDELRSINLKLTLIEAALE